MKTFFFVGNMAKGRISKRRSQEYKVRQFFRKANVFYPLIRTRTCAYQGVKKRSFFGKFSVLCILVTSILRFALLPYYRHFMIVELYTSLVSCFGIKVITKNMALFQFCIYFGRLVLLDQKKVITLSYHVHASFTNKKDKYLYH